jgi:hypothetical protein
MYNMTRLYPRKTFYNRLNRNNCLKTLIGGWLIATKEAVFYKPVNGRLTTIPVNTMVLRSGKMSPHEIDTITSRVGPLMPFYHDPKKMP